MKPTGIRQVLAEQGTEGAIIYLHEMVEKMAAELEQMKLPPTYQPVEQPKEEV